ncbi:MAG TPA: GNAT family N-acetyltransferase [Thermodesulfobacteriota bacterium]|jgi:ribosomal protein S18 acetylase RimI-like enzyme|nr:GNAT family N-acetyltransferase [Thermodesulfobacteriota bacterium]
MWFSIRNVDPRPILRELLEVYKRAYEEWEEYAYHTDRRILDYIKWLGKRAPEGFLVAFVDGRPVGFVAVDYNWIDYKGDPVGEIHELVVDPEFQYKGIGKGLLLAGLNVLVERGCRRFGLWVGKGNIRAQSLYRSLGFRIEERGGVWIRMVKD